jgi:hypothetical protein
MEVLANTVETLDDIGIVGQQGKILYYHRDRYIHE